ncbi:unnamed protein product [Owenia fusiformis]|uniref:Uncharacterized protein n=1 Tax=Owenia fusiformis TaxID=6347 RepID=A0A8J1T808_OWEFU|nr:unnamed protein product [Owenia fusiformis]
MRTNYLLMVLTGGVAGLVVILYLSSTSHMEKFEVQNRSIEAKCNCEGQGQSQPQCEPAQAKPIFEKTGDTQTSLNPIHNRYVALTNDLSECDCSGYMEGECQKCKNCGWCIARDKDGNVMQQCIQAKDGKPLTGTCNIKWCPEGDKPCKMYRKLVIFGNGPSLKGFNFHEVQGVDSLGMNQAYRYWSEINWYPTYYFSFDTVVNVDRSKDIIELINNSSTNGIKKFFTRSNFYGRAPQFKNDPRVQVFEDYRKGRHIVSIVSAISTGNLATRFGILMGYDKILIMGIDMNYVEHIKESEKYKGVLKIKETPDDNPNYFFKGYQQKGDVYNVPNSNAVHVPAFRQMFGDVKKLGLKVDIYNGSPISKLKEMCPFMTFKDFMAL